MDRPVTGTELVKHYPFAFWVDSSLLTDVVLAKKLLHVKSCV